METRHEAPGSGRGPPGAAPARTTDERFLAGWPRFEAAAVEGSSHW